MQCHNCWATAGRPHLWTHGTSHSLGCYDTHPLLLLQQALLLVPPEPAAAPAAAALLSAVCCTFNPVHPHALHSEADHRYKSGVSIAFVSHTSRLALHHNPGVSCQPVPDCRASSTDADSLAALQALTPPSRSYPRYQPQPLLQITHHPFVHRCHSVSRETCARELYVPVMEGTCSSSHTGLYRFQHGIYVCELGTNRCRLKM
jgi:hypothetical protein